MDFDSVGIFVSISYVPKRLRGDKSERDDSMKDHISGRSKSSLSDRYNKKDDSRVTVRGASEDILPRDSVQLRKSRVKTCAYRFFRRLHLHENQN